MDILQNNWSVLFRSSKVINDKEKLRNCHRLDETKTRKLKATWDPKLDPESEKGHKWEN